MICYGNHNLLNGGLKIYTIVSVFFFSLHFSRICYILKFSHILFKNCYFFPFKMFKKMGEVGWGWWMVKKKGTTIQVKKRKTIVALHSVYHPFISWYQCRLSFSISWIVYGFITVDVPYMMYMLHSLSLPLQACNISVVEVETVLVALVEVVAFFCGSDDTHTFCLFCWFTISHQGALWAWFGSANINKNSLMLSRRAKGILDATPRKTKKASRLFIRKYCLNTSNSAIWRWWFLTMRIVCLKLWLLEMLHHILSL